VTQQNAALVEQAAAAAESLEEQAQGLSGAVSVFKMNPGSGKAVGAVRTTAPAKPAPAKAVLKPAPKHAGHDDEWKEF
jgi:methyl-accepting chemotaxis protein